MRDAQLPAVILAGGQARRMGGGDKVLLPLGGMRLIDHIIARLVPQCGPVALNANGDAARFDGLGLPVLPDGVAGWPGPLAGVLAGLDWAAGLGADAIATVAGDTPFFPRDLVARLREAAATAGSGGLALAASPDDQGAMRAHPTFGLWPVALRDDLRAALADGQRRVGAYARKHGAGLAEWPCASPDPFFNINHAEDLAMAEAQITAG